MIGTYFYVQSIKPKFAFYTNFLKDKKILVADKKS